VFLYRLSSYLLFPFYFLFTFILVLFGKIKVKSLLQRLGYRLSENISSNSIWVHAVSAGEVVAVTSLILYLRQKHSIPIVLTTTTSSGFVMAKKRLGEDQLVFYSPFDLLFIVKKFYKKINPILLLVMEMELWPELFDRAKKRSCPIYIINGRMPLKDYQRYRHFKKSMKRLFSSVVTLFVQSKEDGLRYLTIGADRSKIEVLPNLKYDNYISQKQVVENGIENIFNKFKNRQVVVIGSSHGEEELFLLKVIERLKYIPNILIIWAPRNINRVAKIERKLKTCGFISVRRSSNLLKESEVIILDSYGELIDAYKIANLVLLGGSWSKAVQGHNPLEASVLGKPVIFGSNMGNFKNIADDLINNNAAFQVDDLLETVNLVQKIISDSILQNSMGEAGMDLVKSRQVAMQKYREFIVEGYREAIK